VADGAVGVQICHRLRRRGAGKWLAVGRRGDAESERGQMRDDEKRELGDTDKVLVFVGRAEL